MSIGIEEFLKPSRVVEGSPGGVDSEMPDSGLGTFFALVQMIYSDDCQDADTLETKIGPNVDVRSILCEGLERVLVYAPFFERLMALVNARRGADKSPRVPELSNDKEAGCKLPSDLRRRILDEGLSGISLPELFGLIGNRTWLKELWEALDCLPPFWLKRSEELRQGRRACEGWFRKAAATRLDVLRQGDIPQAMKAFRWLIQRLLPRLQRILEREGGRDAEEIENTLEQAWATLWNKRIRWRAGEEGLEELRCWAVRKFRLRLRARLLESAQMGRGKGKAETSCGKDLLVFFGRQELAYQIKQVRENYPDLAPCDRKLLQIMARKGALTCIPRQVCKDLAVTEQDAREHVDSLIRVLRHEFSLMVEGERTT